MALKEASSVIDAMHKSINLFIGQTILMYQGHDNASNGSRSRKSA